MKNQNKGNSGCRPSVTKDQGNIDLVRDSAIKSPKKSHRRRSRELAISASSVWRILTSELKLYPYIISVRHKLTLNDMASRVTMCDWFSDRMERYPNWINSLWLSDEAHFQMNGASNNHNLFCGAEPPEVVSEISLKGPKSTCFCALNAR